MSTEEDKLRGYLRLASAELHQARSRLQAEQQRRQEPIAIIGMGCRYPGGVTGPDELWQLVEQGRDAISEFPDDRGWPADLYDPDPDSAGHSTSRHGGFLDDIAGFDARFFNLPAREAAAVDPQQRLLLEISWEAIERAGIDPRSLAGSSTGVFLGIMYGDYGGRARPAPPEYEGYLVQGSAGSIASGRISFSLGLHGPAVTVDTACSSSLVGIQLACTALRNAECELALAGGATVMATPDTFIEFSRQRGLAADGRCKSFSADADGTGWGEGAGVLLLERLSDARRNDHPVLAVIRGGALNSDGASSQLSAPNGQAQQRVIRQALAAAGLEPSDIDLIEAHGTGTQLGDPIEANALQEVYGSQPREFGPAGLGSLKSNIGHTQAAAGVGGVIKLVGALRHGLQPRSLHAERPSGYVDWSAGGISLLTESRPWPSTGRPRRAAVSSFGISGTNAHLILEQAPAPDRAAEPEQRRGPLPFLLSGRTGGALTESANRLRNWLQARPELPLASISRTLATGRSQFEHRAVLTAEGRDELLDALRALGAGEPAEPTVTGRTLAEPGRVAFVFPGQGSQWQGMAADLMAEHPAFAERMAACDEQLRPLLGWSVVAAATGGELPLESAEHVQPVLFAMMVSLAETWRGYGIRPQAVIGHSQGEIAAAAVAGALSLPDAARVVALRSLALRKLAGLGGMLSIAAAAELVQRLLADLPDGLVIAAYNGPRSTVVAGPRQLLERLAAASTEAGVDHRWIAVDYASHHPDVDRIRDELAEALAGISPQPPQIPMFSTVHQRWVRGSELDAGYWFDNLRRPVRFAPSVAALAEAGYSVFVEPTAHPILTSSVEGIFDSLDRPVAVTGTLRRKQGGRRRLLESAAALHVRGVDVHWPVPDAPSVQLPTYPFEHERHWVNATAARSDVAELGLQRLEHPLLGCAVPVADAERTVWTARISLADQPWLADHRIGGQVWLPAAAFVELALLAGRHTGLAEVAELVLEAPLVLPERDAVQLQLIIDRTGPDEAAVSWHARPADDLGGPWTRHARARLAAEQPAVNDPAGSWPPAGTTEVAIEDFYARAGAAGYAYGPGFQGLRRAWRADDGSGDAASAGHGDASSAGYGEVALPDGLSPDGWLLHPALLDAALQVRLATGQLPAGGQPARVPFAWTGIRLAAVDAGVARVSIRPIGEDEFALRLLDVRGRPVLSVGGVALRPADAVPAEAGPDIELDRQEVELDLPVAGELPGELPGHQLVALLPEQPAGDPVTAGHAAVERIRRLSQQWLAEHAEDDELLVVSGPPAADDAGRLAMAAVAGYLRSVQAEHPGRVRLIVADTEPADLLPAMLASGEPEIRLAGGRCLVPRLRRIPPAERLRAPATASWRLGLSRRGTVDNLLLVPTDAAERALAPGEVRVAVRVAGLNFRDVMISLGMYPGTDVEVGGEACATVLEVGSEVAALRPGDRVTGLFPAGGAGNIAITDARLLTAAPAGWTDAEAATLPVVFLTALYGLRRIANLRPGERLLVHAATGGVGLAALQLARHFGAEVFATASPPKWPTLRALGIDESHLASSRDAGFEPKFRDSSGGRGMDVVLNALAGELTDASLRLLSPGGRFLEMGKTDLRPAAELAERHPGVDYHPYDLLDAGPQVIAELLAELAELIERGVLRPLPVECWPIGLARQAARKLSQARHIGKLALVLPQRLPSSGSVLIVGGTGTLGRLLAEHLVVRHGVRTLVLAGRRGPDAPGAAELRTALAERGAEVRLARCDATDPGQLADLLAGIPDLRAVVHAAGVLADATSDRLTAEQLNTVLSAKLDSAWQLHRLTAGRQLDAFVLFSSLAGTLGTAGQANYAAANAFVNELARLRAEAAQPASSLVWGLWEAATDMTGHLAERDRQRLARTGLDITSSDDGLRLFDRALLHGEPVVYPVALQPKADPDGLPAVLRGLFDTGQHTGHGTAPALRSAANSAATLAELPADQRAEQLRQIVLRQLSAALGDAGTVELDERISFKQLGVDSLIAVEFRNRLAAAVQRRLPATLVFDHPTPRSVHGYLCGLFGDEQPGTASAGEQELRRLAAALDSAELAEQQRGRLLRQLEALVARHRPQAADDADDLDSATDDELFSVLDNELGIS